MLRCYAAFAVTALNLQCLVSIEALSALAVYTLFAEAE